MTQNMEAAASTFINVFINIILPMSRPPLVTTYLTFIYFLKIIIGIFYKDQC